MPVRDVFLCHASKDAEVANALVTALEQAGLSCWIAPRDVIPGSLYAESIVRAINSTRVLVLLLSEHAVASPHVGKEIERASSKRHPVIAIRLDATPLPPAFEYFLSESHWLEASGRGAVTLAPQIARAVRDLEASGGTAPPAGRSPPATARHVTSRRDAWVAGLLGVLLVGVVGYWLVQRTAPATNVSATTASANAVSEKSIAVLPFADLSENHDQAYFADGMADEVLNSLAQLPELKVIGRASSFQFRSASQDLRKVGAALGAVYVLDGSVRRSGDHLRITAQLNDTRNGTRLWSQTFDRTVRDSIAIQDEIATGIVRALQVEVMEPPGRVRPKNAEAYDHYLRCRHASDRYTEEGFNEAIAECRHSLDADPGFAPAAAQLAMNRYYLKQWGFVAGKKGYEDARAAAEVALNLDPQSADAHEVRAIVTLESSCDWQDAERELMQALKASPHHAGLLITLAQQRIAIAQYDEAARLVDAAVSRDPFDASNYAIRVWAYARARRFDLAEVAARRILEIASDYGWAHAHLSTALAGQGKFEEAMAEARKETVPVARAAAVAIVYRLQNRSQDADAALSAFKLADPRLSSVSAAKVLTAFGDYDGAFAALDRAREGQDPDLCYIKGHPYLAALQADPRWPAFLRKINLPE